MPSEGPGREQRGPWDRGLSQEARHEREGPSDFSALSSTGMGQDGLVCCESPAGPGSGWSVAPEASGTRSRFLWVVSDVAQASPDRGLAREAHVTSSLVEAAFLESTEKQVEVTCFVTREHVAFPLGRLVTVRELRRRRVSSLPR